MGQLRKKYDAKFKLKVVLEFASGRKTSSQISSEYGISSGMLSDWKKKLNENAKLVFEDKRHNENKEKDKDKMIEGLLKKIGQLSYENDWLEKKTGIQYRIPQ